MEHVGQHVAVGAGHGLEEVAGQHAAAVGEVGGGQDGVRVMRDKATGQSRGFAFVEMETEDGARAAIERFNTSEVEGRRLAVNEARPQVPGGGPGGGGRPFGGGGGGRGGGGGGGFGGRRREPRW